MRGPRLRLAVWVAAAFLVAPAGILRAEGESPAAARPRAPAASPDPLEPSSADDPLTSLEAGPLARSDLVVLGNVRVVKRGIAGAPTLVRVDVAKTLRGALDRETDGDSINLFVAGERPTTQASERSRPVFASDAPGAFVLFLRRSPAGSGFTVEALFDAEGEFGSEKVHALEQEIAIAATKDPVARRRLLLSHLLDLLGKESPWSRLHAAQEIDALAASAPEAFDESALAEIAAARDATGGTRIRSLLSRAMRRAAPDWTPKAPASRPSDGLGAEPTLDLEPLRRRFKQAEGDEARVTALTALGKTGTTAAVPDLLLAFGDSSVAVRERATALLGDVRATTALPTLLAAFPTERDVGVREAIVRAVGLGGDETSVPWLVARTDEPALERAVLFALARIRTAAALAALAKERERLLTVAVPEKALARLIDYLRGDAFVAAERAAGREIGPGVAAPPGTVPR